MSRAPLPPTIPGVPPCSEYGQVIMAADRFLARNCPRNSFVFHRVHGNGTVAACAGHERVVDFECQITKLVEDLLPHEWPADEDPETLVSVSWISITRQTVPVSELRVLERVASDKYKRWSS